MTIINLNSFYRLSIRKFKKINIERIPSRANTKNILLGERLSEIFIIENREKALDIIVAKYL